MDRQPDHPAAPPVAPRRTPGRGVVLVDPDTGMRRVVRALLEGHRVPVVAETADVGEMVAVAAARHPAVVLAAMHLGDRRLLWATRELVALGPRVVLLTSTDPAVIGGPAVEVGAFAVVVKGDAAGLIAAVGHAAAGEPGR